MRIWIAASENGALPGGKVGGIGDVVRELPRALVRLGHDVTVVTPSYGAFHRLPGAERVGSVRLSFGGRPRRASLHRVPDADSAVRCRVIEHGAITRRRVGRIYHHDGSDAPFATDAGRFAFFSAALAALVEQTDSPPDVLHLHDWHTGALYFLREFDAGLPRIRDTRCVFTIHNLAYQGIRPRAGHTSSLEAWFPTIAYRPETVADPRYDECVNPMATAIRLADSISTVSPGYAREILEASDPEGGFIGGEGLEGDLRSADAEGRLVGILNGCPYPEPGGRRPGWERLLDEIAGEPHLFTGPAAAQRAVRSMPRRRPATLLVSVGRITDQKVDLFLRDVGTGRTALEAILERESDDFAMVLLGSGDPVMEERIAEIAAREPRLLFLRGYSEKVAHSLYRSGDLFLMPSSFEPCGISQMLAMRAGQPCVVHAVGGLADTVVDGRTGFVFEGNDPEDQAGRFVEAVDRAFALMRDEPSRWEAMRRAAASERFTWDVSARGHLEKLYAS